MPGRSHQYQHSEQPDQERRLDNLVRDVTGGQSRLVPFPSAVRGSDGEVRTSPMVLDCGIGNAVWVNALLDEENNNDIDVSKSH